MGLEKAGCKWGLEGKPEHRGRGQGSGPIVFLRVALD